MAREKKGDKGWKEHGISAWKKGKRERVRISKAKGGFGHEHMSEEKGIKRKATRFADVRAVFCSRPQTLHADGRFRAQPTVLDGI